MGELVTIKEASIWASDFTNRNVTESNISYLIQYGRINRYNESGVTKVSIFDVEKYYNSYAGKKETEWKEKLGNDLNWALSFDNYKEAETTKHVHRLHPYKGKFIPQLVEYFLDDHKDAFKKQVYFNKGDIVLDPFCGSGTTLVQANELGIHAVGIDISEFNSMISNCKIENYDISSLKKTLSEIGDKFNEFENDVDVKEFENELLSELYKFNSVHFPSPEYKKWVNDRSINEKEYGAQKEKEFLPVFYEIARKHNIETNSQTDDSFINKWYFSTAKKEIYFMNDLISRVSDEKIKLILRIILSRTIRSCRATTHSDLATLIEPMYRTYYCTKHKKICKPLFGIKKWWDKYSKDTVERIENYSRLRTDTFQKCFTGDSRSIDIRKEIEDYIPSLLSTYDKYKIKGIFSSPPYVGLIDYHEQHAYAYELFSLERKDDLEIGPLYGGTGLEAQKSYIGGISKVLLNCKKYFCNDYEVFLVANDKRNLYPEIAEKAGMEIVEVFKRPVLNRTEKDKGAYSECIFRMKEKNHVK
jgi:hypothetical protein